ncbi:MAG: protein kinase [Planctomycetes bacterium]|nr:protein kinase [Planctomycetota bacterium]
MTDSNWERIKAIVYAALDLPTDEREPFVERECGEDADLRERCLRLLRDFGRDDDFLRLDPEGDPPEPDRVAEFRIERKIGEGALSRVYEAYDLRLERRVALKLLPGSAHAPSEEVRRFQREAKLSARLDHPAIAKIYHEGELEGHHFIAMELVDGPSLAQEIQARREGRPEEASKRETFVRDVARWMLEVARGLEHAHHAGVVHRDIKPSNLMIGRDGHAKIVDFGIAKGHHLPTLTDAVELMGTLPYMSPEQAKTLEIDVDHRTDIYSLGVTLYETLTQKRPFGGRTTKEIISRITHYYPPPPRSVQEGIPRDLDAICTMAMAKRPEYRYAAAADMAEDLERFLDHRPLRFAGPSVRRSVREFFDRHGRRAALGAALVLLAIVAWQAPKYLTSRRWVPVRIAAFDTDGRELEGSVSYHRIDARSGIPGEERVPLGQLPVSESLEPGLYRFVVQVEGKPFLEFTRYRTDRDDPIEIEARFLAGDPFADMIEIEGSSLRIPAQEIDANCANRGAVVEVAGFWIDKYEVSIGEYRAFLAATGRPEPREWEGLPNDAETNRLPAIYVTWENARRYAEWANKRLVTHPEWELAGRGPNADRYPNPETNESNYEDRARMNRDGFGDDEFTEAFRRNARAVDSDAPGADLGLRTPSGIHFLLGNVAEWTESIMWMTQDSGEDRLADQDRWVMGPAWLHSGCNSNDLRMHHKIGVGDNGQKWVGFRCARSVEP